MQAAGFQRPVPADLQPPHVTLVDVSDTKGVERITATGIVAQGVEREVDCIIFASGFEITTDLDRRLGIEPFAGRDGLSLYDLWAKGYRTLHGITSHGFPNLMWTGFIQGGVTASTTLMFDQQANHIAYVISEALARARSPWNPPRKRWSSGARPSRTPRWTAQGHLRPGVHPGLLQQRGRAERADRYLGEPYWLGFYAMEDLLRDWRDSGEMKGLELRGTDG